MTLKHGLLVTLLVTVHLQAAGPLDDKGPPYFVDRYGPAKSISTERKASFIDSRRGVIGVKGQFSRREFRQGKLRVEAIFFLPSLKLAGVNLRMTQSWTDEQIQAALQAYGAEWEPVKKYGVVKEWVAPDGSRAVYLIASLHIHSKAAAELVAKELAEEDAKRKAVPTF